MLSSDLHFAYFFEFDVFLLAFFNLKISKTQNTSGFFRVSIKKAPSTKQGFIYTYSWYENKYEASDEILYCTKFENVKGHSIFSFKTLTECIDNEERIPHDATVKIRQEYWTKKVNPPKTKSSR